MAGRIVVGVDGSDGSRRAWVNALGLARATNSSITVVHAYHDIGYAYGAMYGMSVPPPDPEEFRREAEALIDKVIGPVPDDVEVDKVVAKGSVARILLEAAGDADILVVGSRGRGGFTGLLLGSTSHQVISHSPCPVLVVPPEE
jgi:nucleotide-binding universal stress UspA family protein